MILLDASAVLAIALDEVGADAVVAAIAGKAYVSTINWAEVVNRLSLFERSAFLLERLLRENDLNILPFDIQQAEAIITLAEVPRTANLSLADRICLGVARHKALPVLTGDRAWLTLGLPLDIRCFR